MTLAEQFQNFNPYKLGNFFIGYYKGKLGVYHSYVDSSYCYGHPVTLSDARQLIDELNVKYAITAPQN